MKKLLSVFTISAVLFGTAFAENFFSQRFFELKVDVPVDVSNNTLGLLDIFQEELVIDLNEFANGMPKDGFITTVNANPQVELNLNLKRLHAGGSIVAGAEVFGQIGLSKDIFDFICNGNEIGEEIKVEGLIRGDAFGFASVNAHFKKGDYGFSITPTFFVPLFHTFSNTAKVSVLNTEEGDIIVDLDGEATIFSFMDVGNENQMLINGGFDIGASVSYYGLNMLQLTGSIRMPIAPGTLNYSSVEKFGMHYETSINSLMGGEQSENNKPFDQGLSKWTDANYKINRPFKLNGMVEFKPLGNLLVLNGGLGLGVRNPFSDFEEEVRPFGEYYLGAAVNLLGLVGASISTEYTNMIYKHQISGYFNVRLFELDFGVSTQSANFATSFKLAGFGAFVNFAIGI